MTMQNIKRAVAGGYVQADMTGTGTFEVGRITRFDADKIWFESAMTGEEVWVQRHAAFKATKAEYEQAAGQALIEEADEADRQIPHREWLGHPDNLEGALPEGSDVEPDEEAEEEEAEEPRSIIKKEYKQACVQTKIQRDGKTRTTQDCGDEIATMLRGKDLDDVYEYAAQVLGVALADLYAKYEHLNPGQQRMTLGNRIRGELNRRAEAEDEAEAA